ncbi:MAG TPA: ATP-binding cassette domain-containing protein [Acidimicrobiales bacterium]
MLAVEALVVQYGGVRALDGCSLEVPDGLAVGIVGPNGSGKTTLLDAVGGFVQPTQGSIRIGGQPAEGLAAFRRARLGLSRAFQIPRPFADLSCIGNLLVAAEVNRGCDGFVIEPADALSLVGLDAYRDVYPRFLSFGQKRLLDIARSLCTRPRMLLLDEPSAGVNPTLAQRILAVLEPAKRAGLTMLVVEHNMDFVRALCDKVAVLVGGSCLRYGPTAEVLADEAVLDAYFGHAIEWEEAR